MGSSVGEAARDSRGGVRPTRSCARGGVQPGARGCMGGPRLTRSGVGPFGSGDGPR
jgi:hypothetical protein